MVVYWDVYICCFVPGLLWFGGVSSPPPWWAAKWCRCGVCSLTLLNLQSSSGNHWRLAESARTHTHTILMQYQHIAIRNVSLVSISHLVFGASLSAPPTVPYSSHRSHDLYPILLCQWRQEPQNLLFQDLHNTRHVLRVNYSTNITEYGTIYSVYIIYGRLWFRW